MKRTTLRTGAVLAALLAPLLVALPATADEGDDGYARDRAAWVKEHGPFRTVRVCDTTGCLVAWHVRDSDGDGYADADELVAGTDPYDPESHPTLPTIVEIATKHQLPTLEYGVGALIAFPAETVKHLQEQVPADRLPSQMFPVASRDKVLNELGLSLDEIVKSLTSSAHGFTVGLNAQTTEGSEFKFSHFDGHVIYYNPGEPVSITGEHGKIVGIERGGWFDGFDVRYTYEDGVTGDVRGDWTHFSDGTKKETHKETVDGKSVTTEKSYDKEGNLVYQTERWEKVYKHGDGSLSVSNYWHNTAPLYDENGNQTGTITVEGIYMQGSDGIATGAETTTVCDNAGNCTEKSMYLEEDGTIREGSSRGAGETGSNGNGNEAGDYNAGTSGGDDDEGDDGSTGGTDDGGTGYAYTDPDYQGVCFHGCAFAGPVPVRFGVAFADLSKPTNPGNIDFAPDRPQLADGAKISEGGWDWYANYTGDDHGTGIVLDVPRIITIAPIDVDPNVPDPRIGGSIDVCGPGGTRCN
jgi:hypothetical protein